MYSQQQPLYPLKEFKIPIFGKIYRPKEYILTSLMAQCINLVFYLGVMILFESGILDVFFNYLKVKLMNEKIYHFLIFKYQMK